MTGDEDNGPERGVEDAGATAPPTADEPTGNLDTENAKAVYKLFRELNRELGTACMIVTHDRSVAQQTDRSLEVQDGLLLQDVRNSYAQGGPPPAV